MAAVRSIPERLILAVLRIGATLVTLAGLAVTASTLVVYSTPNPGAFERGMAASIGRFGAALLIAGLLALYLGISRLGLFRFEHAGAPPVDVRGLWRGLFALTLVALPAWLAFRLQPMISFWREAFAVLGRFGPWDLSPAGGGGGFVLLGALGILSLPAFECLAALAFLAGCLTLLGLLAARSRLLVRTTLIVACLLGGLATAAVLASDGLEALIPTIEREVRRTEARFPGEAAEALKHIGRYRNVTRQAGRSLAWAWMGLMVWVPVLILGAGASARRPEDPVPMDTTPEPPTS